MELTAVINKEDENYVASCPEIGTISQGETVDEALLNLKEATEVYLEEFPDKEIPIVKTFKVAESAL